MAVVGSYREMFG